MPTNPEQAADALRVVAEKQSRVIEVASVPVWYWSVVGALMVVLAAGVDSHRPATIGVTVSIFVVGLLAATARVVAGVVRTAQVRNDLLGARGVLAIIGFVAAIDIPAIAAALALRAAHVRHPATIACGVAGVALAIGGPQLMRYLRRTMLAGRVGS
jgi:hypothetical protein